MYSSYRAPQKMMKPKSQLLYTQTNKFFNKLPNVNLPKCIVSEKTFGIIRGYGANTYRGLVRNYNEDRVAIILNFQKPKSFSRVWPKVQFFGIYDGHGGDKCANFLSQYLHKFVILDDSFPERPIDALKNGFKMAEKRFKEIHWKKDGLRDNSGSCAVVVLIVDNMCYVANVGDSRAILSSEKSSKCIPLTRDHKPCDPREQKRIIEAGGQIYQ